MNKRYLKRAKVLTGRRRISFPPTSLDPSRQRKHYLNQCTLISDLIFLVRRKRGAHNGLLVGIHVREQQILVLKVYVRCFRVNPISHPDTWKFSNISHVIVAHVRCDDHYKSGEYFTSRMVDNEERRNQRQHDEQENDDRGEGAYSALILVSDRAREYLNSCHFYTALVATATSTGAGLCRRRWAAVSAPERMYSWLRSPFQRTRLEDIF